MFVHYVNRRTKQETNDPSLRENWRETDFVQRNFTNDDYSLCLVKTRTRNLANVLRVYFVLINPRLISYCTETPYF